MLNSRPCASRQLSPMAITRLVLGTGVALRATGARGGEALFGAALVGAALVGAALVGALGGGTVGEAGAPVAETKVPT